MNEGEDMSKIEQEAFELTKQILQNPSGLAAVQAGIWGYTANEDAALQDVRAVLEGKNIKSSFQIRGAAHLLWSEIMRRMQQGEVVTEESMLQEDLGTLLTNLFIYHSSV